MQSAKRVLTVLCVLATTMAGAAVPAAAAEPAPPLDSAASAPDPWGPYFMRNFRSGKVMTILNASTAHGAPAVQWSRTNNASSNDMMILEYETTAAANLLRFKPYHTYRDDDNPHNDKCLAVENASRANYARIVQANCTYDSTNNDVWLQEPAPSGGLQFRNHLSRLCITVLNASAANGAQLVQYTCNGTTNSSWAGDT